MPETTNHYVSKHRGPAHREASKLPVLPAPQPVDWKRLDVDPPRPIPLDRDPWAVLPRAPVVIITWTTAEWMALDHVFCGSGAPPSTASETRQDWQAQWRTYRRGFETVGPDIYANMHDAPSLAKANWGSYRLVSLAPHIAPVLLIKSDLHIGTDGKTLPLKRLVDRIVEECQPELILTIGTAGGARNEQCIGTVVVSNSFKLELTPGYAIRNGLYASDYRPNTALVERVRDKLFVKTPVSYADLEVLAKSIDTPLRDLMNSTIEPSKVERRAEFYLETRGSSKTDLLGRVYTSNNYDIGTTSGNLARYSCVEMDDAVIAKVAGDASRSVKVGSVRNISDPVVNHTLCETTQRNWSTALYETYGLYTSLNGALAAWALVTGNASEHEGG
jgi:hypothetical protein